MGLCLCVPVCVVVMLRGVSLVAALLHHAPESAVGKETRARERAASQGAQFRVRARQNGEERVEENESRRSRKKVTVRVGGRWRRELERGGKEHVTV